MTDTPGSEPTGPEPGSEQRLPATRPPAEVAPVERFTSPPSIRAVELSPERAAQVVRQSSNARWVGFLATVIVILFVALYWFYELGAPLGLTEPRLEAEIAAQQVTAVERGYLVYEANCARCHGEQGEGGIGPVLNRQDKLFAHLNENYIKNVLTVGGRYVCGDPKSLMPAWSDTGNPPGPLNYRQIEELIAFLLATNDTTYIVRDEHLLDPKVDPQTGEVLTFTGWRDPNYLPAPGATPYPDCWKDEFASGGSASPGPSGSAAPPASADPSAEVVTITAAAIAFDPTEVTAPADAAFTLSFDNQDAGIPHDVQVKDAAGAVVFKTDVFPGAEKRDYSVPALAAGTYPFVCSVHPNMTGTLTAQ
ncbi:MAG: blue (type 1) copper domain protein [Chloroflexota bacterium]|jgi:mono/diheme cytochrome c family protein/plastocyanin|nr:blue (type 1) copper domain protein [Chloroflexota bacterium]